MMCMYIETFHVSVIARNAIIVVYGILFGGMHPAAFVIICSDVLWGKLLT